MLLERVDLLIGLKKMSRAELERKLNFSAGSIRNWGKSIPSGDKIQKVADYFDVSTDYLLGRTDQPNEYKWNDDALEAMSRAIDADNPEYNELFENLATLDNDEISLVNDMVRSLILFKQKKS